MKIPRVILPLIMLLSASISCSTEPELTEDTTGAEETADQALVGPSCATIRCVEGHVCRDDPRPARCVKVDERVGLAASQAAPACSLPIERGPCRALFHRWGFDARANKCVQFIYGGCGGNANNFPTQAACARACPGSPRPPIGVPF